MLSNAINTFFRHFKHVLIQYRRARNAKIVFNATVKLRTLIQRYRGKYTAFSHRLWIQYNTTPPKTKHYNMTFITFTRVLITHSVRQSLKPGEVPPNPRSVPLGFSKKMYARMLYIF